MSKTKNILLGVGCLILLSGCTKKVTCTADNTKLLGYVSEVKVTFDGNKIKNITNTSTYNSEKIADNMCKLMKATSDEDTEIVCKDKVVTINNYHKLMEESSEIDTKKELMDYFEENNYICK